MIYDLIVELTGSGIIAGLANSAIPLLFLIPFALIAVYAERKISGYMQDRYGPNRVGPYGLFQTAADILKLLQKEDIVPNNANKILFLISPIIVFTASYGVYSAIPFTSAYLGSNVDLGLLFILGISGLVVAGILLGGWASNNKYALIGAMRSAAQVVSYEIPTMFVILSVVAISGSFNLLELSNQQGGNIFNWYLFGGPEFGWQKFALIPFMGVGFITIFTSTLAEVNRTPFDIPEAESELVAGFHTEYTGMKFAFFFLAEYSNMFAVSAIITALFLGGFHSPLGYIGSLIGAEWLIPIEQFAWFTVKGFLFVFVQMWLRWTLPRIRVDQLMTVCWKYLIPISFVNFLIIAFIMLF